MKELDFFVKEDSEIFVSTNIPYLLNSRIKETEDTVTIYVPNAFHAKKLNEYKNRLTEYYSSKNVQIIVDPSLEPSQPENISVYQGGVIGVINTDLATSPFFVGECNKDAFEASERIIKGLVDTLFVYGGVGIGKTHLLHLTAYKAAQKRFRVYINSANNFLEEIKSNLSSRSIYKFIRSFDALDLLIIDDFQKFNHPDLQFSHDILFEIVNEMHISNKRMIFSSDVSPYMFSYMHDRLISRLLNGLVCKMNKLDRDVKRQFLEYHAQRNNITLPEDIKEFIVEHTQNGRELNMFLNIAEMLHTSGELSYQNFVLKIPGTIQDIKKIFMKDVFHKVYVTLTNYFSFSPQQNRSATRKTREQTKIDSVVYYVLYDTMNVSDLRKRLNIDSRLHKYYYEKGKKIYEELPEEVKNEIKELKR